MLTKTQNLRVCSAERKDVKKGGSKFLESLLTDIELIVADKYNGSLLYSHYILKGCSNSV